MRDYPHYGADRDYTTNAPSYYDDLARKNELMKYLAKRVWEFDKKLFESLEEVQAVLDRMLDVIGEGFNEEIQVLLVKWIEDGTLDHIINETLMNKKADITYVDEKERLLKLLIENLKKEMDTLSNEKMDILGYYDEIEISYHRHEKSSTDYYLAKIPKFDKENKRIKIKHDGSYRELQLKTAREYSVRHHASVAINASTFSTTTSSVVGTVIKDGEIIKEVNNLPEYNYIFGYNDDNQFKSFKPNTPAQLIIDEGYDNAITSFIPLLENGVDVGTSLIATRDIFNEPHPRTAIATDADGNVYFFVSEGRLIGQFGMYVSDVIEVLKSHNMKWAHLMDGGGSSQLVHYQQNVNRVSDGLGSMERKIGNILFASKEKVNPGTTKLLEKVGDANFRSYRVTKYHETLRYQRNNYIDLEPYLVNGWKSFGAGGNRVRGWIMPNNTLYLVGTVTGGSIEKNNTFLQLPKEIPPIFTSHHLVPGGIIDQMYKVMINTDGSATCHYWSTQGKPETEEGFVYYIKLDGIFIPLNYDHQGIQRGWDYIIPGENQP